MSTAQQVRDHVEQSLMRTFIAVAELPGTRRAIECELSRLAAAGEITRVRKGLYWKAPQTRFGMPGPHPVEVALAVGGEGSGPAGISAGHELGLTTQVPSVDVVAVPGRVPSPVRGARFVSRSIDRRVLGLRPLEVAIIEVMRTAVIEAPWAKVGEVVDQLTQAGEVRPGLIDEQVRREHHVATRQRWALLGLGRRAFA
jgi:hypothetical protein